MSDFDDVLQATLDNYRKALEQEVFMPKLLGMVPKRPPLTKKQKRRMKRQDRKDRLRMAKDVLKGRHDCGGDW